MKIRIVPFPDTKHISHHRKYLILSISICSFPPVSIVAVLLAGAGATRIHANNGCIVIGSKPLCHNKGSVSVNGGSVTIYGRFDGNKGPVKTWSGCKLNAHWPSAYGDIYYGADNCLYDSKGQNINGQCCTTGQEFVVNPYH
ncbi:meiotically up-regulated family-domain-containing protein [Apiospora arundinis]